MRSMRKYTTNAREFLRVNGYKLQRTKGFSQGIDNRSKRHAQRIGASINLENIAHKLLDYIFVKLNQSLTYITSG